MTLEVNSKSKGSVVYKNVKSLSTTVKFVNNKPLFTMTFSQVNRNGETSIEDITGFRIYESLLTWMDDYWIDGRTDIVCPWCGQHYNSNILNMSLDERTLYHCPKCGKPVNLDDYYEDTVKL